MEISRRSRLKREALSFAWIIGAALFFRAFVAQAYYIPSGSMIPTLAIGDRIFVNRLATRLGPPQRGEIIVFDHPREHGTTLIKRVVATGGDHVEGRDGQVWVNGVASGPSYDFAGRDIPRDNLFMMGDNRGNSSDSRVWGEVPLGLVEGRASFIWWSGAELGRIFHAIR